MQRAPLLFAAEFPLSSHFWYHGAVVAMTASFNRSRRVIGVFGAPIVIAVLTLAGLLAALLFDEFGRYFSWLAVASPLAACAWAWWRLRVNRRA
jgi:hypothetical protein